jgi:nitronate monooxygenase
MARVRRNAFIERWAGRGWELRAQQAQVAAELAEARARGDTDNALLYFGQDAGLIEDIPPAGEVVKRIAEQAEDLLKHILPATVKND